MTAVQEAGTPLVLPGSQFPLGATPGVGGTNFAVASSVADAMTLCLFDGDGRETQVPLRDYDAGVWHGFVPGPGPGQAYGYRAAGPYDPARGLRCNPAKLLLDPYARAISGEVTFGPEVLGYAVGNPDAPSALDSAGHMPRSLVVDGAFGWTDGSPLRRRYSDTIIYEVHVKGFTMSHPGVPAELRGTYAGLGHEAAIGYLTDLGVTAVELLPVHQNVPESFLPQRGLTNYWGYNTIGYFAPHNGYSAAVRAGRPGGQVAEFKAMVDALHAAGLEVILDVVFNHSAEADQMGPTLCFRGLDNPAYYRLDPADPSHYVDTTGCGNSLNAGDTLTLQLIMDSLRYWLTEMHVDGYRFDLAPSLARQEGGFDQMSAFFDLVAQDPVVSQAKLIAEPWDVGQMDSYDVGRFPPLWREWNGKYRDAMRDFWRSHPIGIGEFATRFCGSADLYGGAGRRRPTASVNLFTVHDGFTLADLVSYNGPGVVADLLPLMDIPKDTQFLIDLITGVDTTALGAFMFGAIGSCPPVTGTDWNAAGGKWAVAFEVAVITVVANIATIAKAIWDYLTPNTDAHTSIMRNVQLEMAGPVITTFLALAYLIPSGQACMDEQAPVNPYTTAMILLSGISGATQICRLGLGSKTTADAVRGGVVAGINFLATGVSASMLTAGAILSRPVIDHLQLLPRGNVGKPYEAQVKATGGDHVFNQPLKDWSVIAGALPPGLTLDAATGVIKGTPTQAVGSRFTVQCSDSYGPPQFSNAAELWIGIG